MKVKNEFVESLVDAENPFPYIFSEMVNNIWEYRNDVKEFYKQGQEMKSFEKLLNESYSEIYTELLPNYCVGYDLEIDLENRNLIMMDSMSIRESVLLKRKLEDEGFETNHSFSFSAIPSDTEYFKTKIGYDEKKKGFKTRKIRDSSNLLLEGDEDIIWSVFPDSRLENIQEGKTVLSNTKEMYEEVENIVMNVLKQHEGERFLITSDHGYTKSTGGYQFRANREDLRKVREVMGGSRYKKAKEDGEIKDMVNTGFLVYFNKYAMARGRYTWPIGGKYSVYQHGGVSLMECLTPKLKVDR